MVINWIPDDFATREYADINVSFYNVSFLGKNGMEFLSALVRMKMQKRNIVGKI